MWHPRLVKELLWEASGTMLVLGTPESGVSVRAGLGMAVPILAFARNQAHVDALKGLVKEGLIEESVTPGASNSSARPGAGEGALGSGAGLNR